ncbi:endonuclease/exonuclease/phosphatase family protein [Pseudonocardia sp.]|uniref:endonuclease/exonuclease/phosphatase family protein n=1 Tax=Pseudonocardia sp. TaxID=60912 RepID=UPI00260D4667|nr:endonuclease/exonuclease/phosphatase family protein [Pseudonocardia sp.]
MRGRWIAQLLAVCVVVGCASSAPPAPRDLSVLTFNIHHGAGPDGVVDLDRVAAEIAATGADVVALQEVDRHYGQRTGFADQPAELAARLDMAAVFAPNYVLDPPTPGAPPREHGTVILSRLPIVSHTHTLLPRGTAAEEEQRGLLEAVVDVRGVAVRVMTTHLESDFAQSRLPQAQAVAAAVQRSAEPVVLTGDLNGAPGAPEVTTLTALLADSGVHGAPTFPAWAPTARIDYVLAGFRVVSSEVLATSSSDHRPVLAGVAL